MIARRTMAACARRPPHRPRPPAARRAALYARVSTDDKGQDPETQLRQLREYAGRRGFEVAGEFVDFASGTRNDRPSYKRLLEAVRKRQVDVVLVWRYDRFRQGSCQHSWLAWVGRAIAPPLTAGAGRNAVHWVRVGGSDGAPRAHRSGLSQVPLPLVRQAVQ